MLRSVFAKSLRDSRRGLVIWAVAMLVLGIYIVGFYPAIQGASGLQDLINGLPPAIKAIIGNSDYSTASGYLNAELFSVMGPILFIAYAAVVGSGAIAGEEDRGTLDLLLSNPVSRSRVYVEKVGALMVGIGITGGALWVATVGTAVVFKIAGIDAGNLLAAMVSSCLLGLSVGAIAFALGAATGSRALAAGVAAAVAIVGYIINAYAPLVDALNTLKPLSLVFYYSDRDPVLHGLQPGNALVLLVFAAVVLALGLVAFRRRDLAV